MGVNGGIAMSNPTATVITHVLNNEQEFLFFCGVLEDLVVVLLWNQEFFLKFSRMNLNPTAGEFVQIAGDGVLDIVSFGIRKKNKN